MHWLLQRKGFNYEERCQIITDFSKANAKDLEKKMKSEQAKRGLKKGLKFLAAQEARNYYRLNDNELKKDIEKLITGTFYKFEYYRNKSFYCGLISIQLSDSEED